MWCTKNIDEIQKELKSNIKNGLTEEEAKIRIDKYGKNQLEEMKKESIIIRFLKQFNDFMIIILILAAIISAVMTKMQGGNDYIDSIIIIAIVVFNSLMGLIQESKAEKSLEALKKMSSPKAKVKRDGKVIEIDSKDVTIGDIIILEAGNYVPADCRLISSYNLKIEESALTGETVPSEKEANSILKPDIPIGDMKNCAFSTTIVVNGHGEAIVTDIGMNTKVGKIAKLIINNDSPETPIQRKLSEVGKILGFACIIICIAIFCIGILKKISIVEMFMTSIGLAVAAIPEGLPAIITIMLSIGVTKMAKKNIIIRKLPAVETLGSSTVICSDKTGTLTQNKMKVVRIENVNSTDKKFTMTLACMCTDCNIETENGKKIAKGEATENAIVNEALENGIDKNELYSQMKRINEIPFDSNRKLMTTIHKFGNRYRIITKGAPDILLSKCNKYYQNGNVLDFNFTLKNSVLRKNDRLAEEALRVLGVAYLDVDVIPNKIDTNTIENNLIFVGLIGMIDPPREGVKEAIAECNKAGIKTVMITGDHIITAKAIAKELNILKGNDLAITGTELDKISDSELRKNIMNYSVFARVSPEHKVKIVKAFRETGAVVAMTGDGVNDAPALKNADIGVSMGKNGTDVAKNASDMILTDDNFTTIVNAVKQGRIIFDNMIKAIHFLISTNIAEIVTIFIGLILGFDTPLIAIQLLWINLVTDSLPAIALSLEPAEKDIMERKTRNTRKSIFADGLWGEILTEGIMMGIITLIAFTIGNNYYGIDVGRTMAFITLGVVELIHSFNLKSKESIFKTGILNNKYLVGAFVLGTLMQVGVVCIPFISSKFKLVALNSTQWIYTVLISISVLVIMEIQKWYNHFSIRKNRVYTSKKISEI